MVPEVSASGIVALTFHGASCVHLMKLDGAAQLVILRCGVVTRLCLEETLSSHIKCGDKPYPARRT